MLRTCELIDKRGLILLAPCCLSLFLPKLQLLWLVYIRGEGQLAQVLQSLEIASELGCISLKINSGESLRYWQNLKHRFESREECGVAIDLCFIEHFLSVLEVATPCGIRRVVYGVEPRTRTISRANRTFGSAFGTIPKYDLAGFLLGNVADDVSVQIDLDSTRETQSFVIVELGSSEGIPR